MIDLPGTIRGALEIERTERGFVAHRLPAWARARGDAQLAMVEAQPSGVRLVFRTAATVVELVAQRTKVSYVGAAARPDGVYELFVDGEPFAAATVGGGDELRVDMTTGGTELRHGEPGTARFAGLPARPKDVEIWLPHNELTTLVELRADAPASAANPDGRRKWLHHGSSISQGSNAASPVGTWPAVAARHAGVALTNLGFGGSMLLDPFTAQVLRDTPADVVSVKIGINLVNADLMRVRAFGPAVHGFLDTIRAGHPDAPLLVVSPLLCPIHEDTPGPGAPVFEADGVVRFRATGEPGPGKLTLKVIREELGKIVAQRSDDPNLHLLDGLSLYGEQDFAELPLPDALHPDAETHQRVGERFARSVFGAGGPFAAAG
ncbi:GDSL-type esterase/lipase family protein [Amycolatopsis rhabdoformis]|uniref:GDSL-type esterase/lipase family protein n=1 Tax=Amycolatopsis rhabdoformis TaxID=1448059 RepID=A0ABZ1IMX1_9PSEU|nr:GDSL-type esterase/lipase family protein [Amycolatopsis rhabdoformis]WSE35061.1 GDSL-type esterase/lipase family protein [Amycolatopsis rhabdoformis]